MHREPEQYSGREGLDSAPRGVAGASYALLFTHQGVLGLPHTQTQFVFLASLIGLILLLQAVETRRTASACWSGLAFGVAFMMKQPGILLGTFAFFLLGRSMLAETMLAEK